MKKSYNMKFVNGQEVKIILDELLDEVKDCYGTQMKRSFKDAFYATDRTFSERCNLVNRLNEIFDNSVDEFEMQKKLDMLS